MRLVTFRTVGHRPDGPRGIGALVVASDGRTAGDGVPRASDATTAERGSPPLGIAATHVLPLGALPDLDSLPGIGRALASGDMATLLDADPGLVETRRALEELRRAIAGGSRIFDRHRGLFGSLLVDLADVRLLAPVPRPGKVVCVGLNYRDHVEEQHIEPPSRPVLFAKFANAIVGGGDPVIRHDATHALDLEAELAVVVGRRGHRLRQDQALEVVAGYTVANDVTARDLQGQKAALAPGERGDGQWLRAKGSDTFLPIGPALVTPDEVPAPDRLAVRSWRIAAGDGAAATAFDATRPTPMQAGTTADMLWSVPELLAFVTAVITLEPGDLVLTGTPAGVGVFRDPPVFLLPGDVASVEVEGLGRLDNPIVAADGTVPPGSPAEQLLGGASTAG